MKNDTSSTELYPENRDKVVAFKMTQSEKDELEKFCTDNGFSVSRFCRHSVKNAMGKK